MSTTSTAIRPFTYDDLLRMPDDGNRYEIIDGELFVSAAPGKKHQRLGSRLHLAFGGFVVPRELGDLLFAPVDVRISPTDIVQPDILFISRERMEIFAGDIVEGAPDLVLEILSPSTRHRDETAKLALYAAAGVREYWIVDPDARSIRLYVLSETGGYRLMEPVGGVMRSTVLSGLEIDVDELFAGLD